MSFYSTSILKYFTDAFSSSFQRAPSSWIVVMALAGFLLFTTTELFEPNISRKGEWLMLIGTVLSISLIWRQEPSRFLYLGFVIFLFYLVAVSIWAQSYWDEQMNHLSVARDYLRMFWFIVVGWWLGGRERAAIWALSLGALAFILATLWNGGLGSWVGAFEGRRVNFGFHNAQHTAIFAGTLLIGVFTVGLRLQGLCFKWSKCSGFLLWSFLSAFSLVVFIGAQARQAWIGLCLAACVGLIFYFMQGRLSRVSHFYTKMLGVVLVAGLAIGLIYSGGHYGTMEERITPEVQAIQVLWLEGVDGDVPFTSASVRLMQWHLALERIAERPWFGYGGDARKELIRESELPMYIREHFGHFHNSYLELWLGYGVFAPLTFIALLLFLAVRLVQAYRSKRIPFDFALFGVAWIVFFAVVNLFESYVNYRSSTFLFIVVAGALYTIANPWVVDRKDSRLRSG